MNKILEYFQSFMSVVLMLFGIVGVCYHLFRDEGWIESGIGKAWEASLKHPLIVIPVIIAVILFGKLWMDRRGGRSNTSKVPDFLIYLLMAGGFIFVGRWVMYGTL